MYEGIDSLRPHIEMRKDKGHATGLQRLKFFELSNYGYF